MGEYDQTILFSHINTLLGALLLVSVGLGAGLLIWHTATGSDPLQHALTQSLYPDLQ